MLYYRTWSAWLHSNGVELCVVTTHVLIQLPLHMSNSPVIFSSGASHVNSHKRTRNRSLISRYTLEPIAVELSVAYSESTKLIIYDISGRLMWIFFAHPTSKLRSWTWQPIYRFLWGESQRTEHLESNSNLQVREEFRRVGTLRFPVWSLQTLLYIRWANFSALELHMRVNACCMKFNK